MICERNCEIDLFGEFCLTATEARALILAYSGADVIREWRRITPDDHRVSGCPASASNVSFAYFAGVHKQRDSQAQGAAGVTLLGKGCTPTQAVEDLLWRVIGPRLLTDEGV